MVKDDKVGNVSIFMRPVWVVALALMAAVAWGWAYPLIKLGFEEFGIAQGMVGGKMLFAGVRFALAGCIVLIIAGAKRRRFAVAGGEGWLYVLLFALLNTGLHYYFFYTGLSYSPGARAAIINALGTFMLVIAACFVFKSDRLTTRKIIGCLVGFGGIMVLNVGGDAGGGFTLMGDGMIVLNAVCATLAGLMTRGLGRRVDVFVGTGYSLAFGGVMLLAFGALAGGTLPVVTPWGVVILFLLVSISAFGFAVYNKLLTCNPVGKVAIFNSIIPVVGAVTSCLCLGEPFHWKYMVAALLAAAGIYIINRGK